VVRHGHFRVQTCGIADFQIPGRQPFRYNYSNLEAAMECNKKINLSHCNCSYSPCSRKGICCECLRYHLASRELPACVFPADIEQTYDRSFERFAALVQAHKV